MSKLSGENGTEGGASAPSEGRGETDLRVGVDRLEGGRSVRG